jgi:hypothetical protein
MMMMKDKRTPGRYFSIYYDVMKRGLYKTVVRVTDTEPRADYMPGPTNQ